MRLLIVLALLGGCEKKKHDEPVRELQPQAAPKYPVESGLPRECDEYRRTIEAITKCEKMPKESIAALKAGLDSLSHGWTTVDAMPAAARMALAQGCKQGTDALKQATAALCGLEQPLESDVPPACDEYRRMINTIQHCEKLPLAARESLKQGFEQISKTWRDQSMPADQRRALADACKQATDALKQVAANGCDLEKSP